MADETPVGPLHPDCPTCACGKRAPVQPGGSISWPEHERVWTAYAKNAGTNQSAEQIAEEGGFSIGQITELLGEQPKSWRATPAERVAQGYVEVFEDGSGEWRWHRKAANGEIVADSGEGYADGKYAAKMAARLNPSIEVRIPDALKAPVPVRDPIVATTTPAAEPPSAEEREAAAAEPADEVAPHGASPLEPPAGS